MRLEAEQNDDIGRLLPLDAMLFVVGGAVLARAKVIAALDFP